MQTKSLLVQIWSGQNCRMSQVGPVSPLGGKIDLDYTCISDVSCGQILLDFFPPEVSSPHQPPPPRKTKKTPPFLPVSKSIPVALWGWRHLFMTRLKILCENGFRTAYLFWFAFYFFFLHPHQSANCLLPCRSCLGVFLFESLVLCSVYGVLVKAWLSFMLFWFFRSCCCCPWLFSPFLLLCWFALCSMPDRERKRERGRGARRHNK